MRKFDCQTCTDPKREAWGCEELTPTPVHVVNGHRVRRCPVKILTPFTRRCMSLYAHYKNGFLPNAGGIADQPAWYVTAMEILESDVVTIQHEQLERERRKTEDRPKPGRYTGPRR